MSAAADEFVPRHIGPSSDDIEQMLAVLGCASLDELSDSAAPPAIRVRRTLAIPPGRPEQDVLAELRRLGSGNEVWRSLIGMGYQACVTPAVIQRLILENPGWYTQYTPYQAEISQGRLEALLNFQTMVADLTGLPVANASLLDEATAAAEAMAMCQAIAGGGDARPRFFVDAGCHPQTIAVVRTRARALDIDVVVGDALPLAAAAPGRPDLETFSGVLVQYPTTDGRMVDYGPLGARVHAAGALLVAACDLLALTVLRPPGQWTPPDEPSGAGADIAVGSAQRFGMPLGFGGPHAGFMATRSEYVRRMPGRLVGLSRDARGRPACRLAIQTREQHIRREKATSNICTAQVLPAIVASMYAVYHGPGGLRAIAQRIHGHGAALAAGLRRGGCAVLHEDFFDTLRIRPADRSAALAAAARQRINLRDYGDGTLGVALDERTTGAEVQTLIDCCAASATAMPDVETRIPPALARTSPYLTQPVFQRCHAEHELLRYVKRLEARDLSLTTSMIPLGSCTMKLNAAATLQAFAWPEFADIHPAAPPDQWRGYADLFAQLSRWLGEITGLPAVSLQPNAGAQGEYAGLLTIRAWHESRGQGRRRVCLIPVSAHGTNPASAAMAGLDVVAVGCDPDGNVDVHDLAAQAAVHADRLAALMVTYPSTHGVFEEGVRDLCRIVHDHGGLVYLDGANMNALVGLARPGDFGADVCHLNLHKTFGIPHGGGGPGMAPTCAREELRPFLPRDPMQADAPETPHGAGPGSDQPLPASGAPHGCGPVSAAMFGSGCILTIPWAYIALLGGTGLRRATQTAILNANYMAHRLGEHYPILFRGRQGRVAHEFILDCRAFERSAGIRVEDIAKRLMDYGFHAPTMSWPVAGTLMIEPTESESRPELDRLCEALILIRREIADIEAGRADAQDNPLKHAPHPAEVVCADAWSHSYSREQAAYPAPWTREHKFWPAVARIDNAWGDRHLVCACGPASA